MDPLDEAVAPLDAAPSPLDAPSDPLEELPAPDDPPPGELLAHATTPNETPHKTAINE